MVTMACSGTTNTVSPAPLASIAALASAQGRPTCGGGGGGGGCRAQWSDGRGSSARRTGCCCCGADAGGLLVVGELGHTRRRCTRVPACRPPLAAPAPAQQGGPCGPHGAVCARPRLCWPLPTAHQLGPGALGGHLGQARQQQAGAQGAVADLRQSRWRQGAIRGGCRAGGRRASGLSGQRAGSRALQGLTSWAPAARLAAASSRSSRARMGARGGRGARGRARERRGGGRGVCTSRCRLQEARKGCRRGAAQPACHPASEARARGVSFGLRRLPRAL